MAKEFKDLEFTDNYMFVKVLSTDLELCKDLLELILQKKIATLKPASYEKTIMVRPDAKGIRLDVYTEDEDQSVYDVEMQVAPQSDLPKRCRYYHAVNAVDHLPPGADYSELPKSYVIVICKEKLDKTWDKSFYTFLSQCQEEPDRYLDDECWTIILNAEGDTTGLSEELKTFLEYIRTGKITTENAGLAGRLDAAVTRAKQRTEWGVEYMKWEHEAAAIFRNGKEEGKKEEHEKTIAAEKRADAAEEKLRQLQAELEALKNQ